MCPTYNTISSHYLWCQVSILLSPNLPCMQQKCDPLAFLQPPHTPPISDLPEWEEQQPSQTLPFESQVYTNYNSLGGGGNVLPSYSHLYSAPESQGEGMLCDACDQYIPFTQWRDHEVRPLALLVCLSSLSQSTYCSEHWKLLGVVCKVVCGTGISSPVSRAV